MAKHPARHTLRSRIWAAAKKNPVAAIGLLFTIFVGFPAIGAAINYLTTKAEAWTPVFVPDIMMIHDGKKIPVVEMTAEHGKTLDYLMLHDERAALKDAQADLKQNPGSRASKDRVDTFLKSIEDREKRLRPKPRIDGAF